jgi:uncharacterized protein
VHPALLQTKSVAAILDELRFDVDAYDFAWQDYLTCGGFPRAAFEHTRVGAVSDGFLYDLAAWLRRDVDRDAPAESIPLLLDGLAAWATSPLNQRSSAAVLGYTYDSLALRLVKLVSNFGAMWCPQRDDHGRIVRGSQPKLYGNGILATKSILNTDHPTWAVPAPLLALLLL